MESDAALDVGSDVPPDVESDATLDVGPDAALDVDAGVAWVILAGLKNSPLSTSPRAVRFKAQIEGLLAGEHAPVCSICRHIPRHGHEIPKEAKVLNCPKPTLGTGSAIRKCPECGTYYYYKYMEEYDDMYLDTTILLRRMDPAEVLTKLPPDEKEDYEARVPQLLAGYRENLGHPEEFARVEAAWMLTRYAVATSDWHAVEGLLAHEDPVVLRTVFHELSSFDGGQIPAGTTAHGIRAGLQSEEPTIRSDASTILAKHAANSRDYHVLRDLLAHPAPEIVSSAGTQIWRGVRDENLDITPLETEIVPLTRSEEDGIRSPARHALVEAITTVGANYLDAFITNLAAPNPDVREEAALSLSRLADKRVDISQALPRLGKLVTEKKTAYSSLQAILSAASWTKADITPVIPDLVQLLDSTLKSYHTDACRCLYHAIKNGFDISAAYPVLGKRIAALQYSATNIFDIAINRGHDIAPLEPHLLKILPHLPTDAFGETALMYLAFIYQQREDWAALKGLLAHKNKHIPGPAARLLAERGENYGALLPVLARNLYHSYWYVRTEAAAALRHLVEQVPGLKTRVTQAVTQSAPRGARGKKANEELDAFLEELGKD